jgi:hypothetical protein
MKLNDVLSHPLTHRVAKHTHDYGFYITLAMFQKEFIILLVSGAVLMVTISFVQFKLGLEEK